MKNKFSLKRILALISIFAGICTILGISLFGNNDKNNSQGYNDINKNSITTDKGDVIINFGSNNSYTKELSNDNDISSNINNLELNYAVLSDNRFQHVYMGNYTDLSKLNEKYYLENNCVFILNINNPTDHEIKINKFCIVADKIVQIYQPYLEVSLNMEEDGIYLIVLNHGWNDAYNIKLDINDRDNILSEYFNKEDLIINIPKLKSGEMTKVLFLNKDKMIKSPNIDFNYSVAVNPYVQIYIDNSENVFQDLMPIYLYNDKVEIDAIGGNEGFYGAYGFMIDTNLNTYRKEFNVNETIGAGEIFDIPICFFPNKSCSMSFYIEFSVFNGYNEQIISSDSRNIEFHLSSIDSKYVNFDNSIIDLQSIYDDENSIYYISYPDNKDLNPLNYELFMY